MITMYTVVAAYKKNHTNYISPHAAAHFFMPNTLYGPMVIEKEIFHPPISINMKRDA